MKLSIIPSDNSVYIDGRGYNNIDLSWIPEIDGKIIHAVQWLKNKGEIEFVGNDPNLQINTLVLNKDCNFEKAIEQWNEKHQEEELLIKQKLEEEERLKKEEEERIQAQILFEYNKTNIPVSDNGEDQEEEDLFYDIEELLKEI